VDAAQPTIVLKAEDANGVDVTDVLVELGGRKLATSLDGRAIPVDPGKLSFVFRRTPFEPVTVEIVIAEGEKSRTVRAKLGPHASVVSLTPLDPGVTRRSAVGWALPGGLALFGAVSLTFAGLTRLSAGNDADVLRRTCAPHCPIEERSSLSDRLTTVNVALGIGLGSLALAAVSWFAFGPHPPRRSSENAASLP
jgi:hypothetical protein